MGFNQFVVSIRQFLVFVICKHSKPPVHLYFLLLPLFLLLFSCHSNQYEKDKLLQDKVKEEQKLRKESLIKANKYLVKKDIELVESYLNRRGWNMTRTPSGLWYMIYEKGSGPKVEPEDIISLEYNLSLLDGTLCYSSDSLGIKSFKVGKGGVVTGLEEGVLLLHKGDRARFIMLPFLAHGLRGDMDCIPARSTVVYDVFVKGVE